MKPCKAKRASFWGCPSPAAWGHSAESAPGESACDLLPCFSALLFGQLVMGAKRGFVPLKYTWGQLLQGAWGFG